MHSRELDNVKLKISAILGLMAIKVTSDNTLLATYEPSFCALVSGTYSPKGVEGLKR
jgi:hypothetical protein